MVSPFKFELFFVRKKFAKIMIYYNFDLNENLVHD